MLVRTRLIALLAVLCLGLLLVALTIVLADSFIQRTRGRRTSSQPFNSTARLAARLHDAVAAIIAATARDESKALIVAVEVLLEDRVRRARAGHHARAVLARCIATMGAPPANCAVLIARRLERDGRPISGCVERLTCADGTMRTLISLALENEPGAPSSDAIAARLASYYLVATGAERTVLSIDPPSPLPPPAMVAATRATPPHRSGASRCRLSSTGSAPEIRPVDLSDRQIWSIRSIPAQDR